MIDIAIFVGFLLAVVAISIFMSRGAKGSESYFLAGRGLGWWLIGFSLIAANISTEQFVGMSGSAANYLGLAIASYEWMAAVTLVIVAFIFLPQFLKAGIYTIPEFLEKRYNKFSRTVMSLTMMIVLVSVNTAAVIYSGAKLYSTFFAGQDCFGIPLNLYTFAWIIGILAATYVFFGGLKACAWADLLQGSALIVGGGIVLYFALAALGSADPATMQTAHESATHQVGAALPQETLTKLAATDSGWERFKILNAPKLRMNLPWSDGVIPITALMIGLWIPNLYYWGLNQYIMQRTLGSKSLAEGQKGIVFAAFMKLLIPFIVVFPGIMAFNLYSKEMRENAATHNASVLKQFEESREKNEVTKIFPFDADFAKVERQKASEIVTFNAAVVGIAAEMDLAASPDDMFKLNKKHLAEVARCNRDTTTPTITVEKQLTGYDYDAAFPFLMSKLIPAGGFRGFLLAAMLGAVISSLASMLNAASTIFTMDLYKEYFHRRASDNTLVFVGRFCVVLFMVTSCLIAPMLARPEFGGIFNFIQEFQGFISPGILAVFLFGFVSRRAPGVCGPVALLMSPAVYGLLKFVLLPDQAFLDRMAVTLGAVLLTLTVLRIVAPRATPYEATSTTHLEMTSSRLAQVAGVAVIIITAALYIWFWDYATPMFGW
ncbi:MAG: sodium:solute symporter family transporter [Thermoguttaceae bacterium]